METVREIALSILDKVLLEGAYSNLLLNETIQKSSLNRSDVGLLTELVYGTIQYKMTLDYYLEPFIEGKRVKQHVRNILRLSLYQMEYLDRIPLHAILNEAVNLTKISQPEQSGFVNAVLRNITRVGVRNLSEIEDEAERCSIETSHPLWLVKLWTKQYGFDLAKQICKMNNVRPHQYARLNLYRETREQLLKSLNDLDVSYDVVDLLPEAIRLVDENIANLSIYKKGYLNVQDVSSMFVAKILDPQPHERIMDVCAAPGGKSTHIAELMRDQGVVVACDLFEHKIELIRNHARRLGLKSIEPKLIDATRLAEQFANETFDRVLVDAPCSGFGVIRRKPEIKYNKKPEDIDEIIQTQKQIVDSAIKLVKPNGTLVYSTCTINKKENEKMVDYILESYPKFQLNKEPFEKLGLGHSGTVQIIDQVEDADIFFVACFKKTQ